MHFFLAHLYYFIFIELAFSVCSVIFKRHIKSAEYSIAPLYLKEEKLIG